MEGLLDRLGLSAADPSYEYLGPVLAGSLTVVSSIALLKYRSAIRRRLHALQESTFFGSKPSDPFRMIRCKPETLSSSKENPNNSSLKLIALNPDFIERHKDEWQMVSLGDYLSTLRPYLSPNQQLPDWIENEIQASLTAALLKSLGPRFGAAVLPGLGTGLIQNAVQRMATVASSYLLRATAGTTAQPAMISVQDRGGVTLSLSALTYAAEANYQRLKNQHQQQSTNSTDDDDPGEDESNSGSADKATSPLDLLRLGEVGYEPTFNDAQVDSTVASSSDEKQPIVPNPFIVSEHWDRAIESMELLIIAQEQSESNDDGSSTSYRYDPHSRALAPPKPIDERVLPDLHLGWGSAKCTHTRRQILQNRLLAVLLNRLAYNYYRSTTTESTLFQLQMNLEDDDDDYKSVITKPGEFLQALVNLGHTVEACVRTHATTFGLGLCLKEEGGGDNKNGDDGWTNIPLAFFLLNGYADADENDAFVALPHSGLNLEVRGGPLLSKGSIQHFMAIDGLCGWHSNHNVDVPWIHDVDCGKVYRSGDDVVECVRVAAMEAVVINAVGTKYSLPFGGYGLSGVCNDSAALLEYALSGETHVYPLSFNGKFAMHNLRLARQLRDDWTKQQQQQQQVPPKTTSTAVDERDVQSLDRLIHAIASLPSDLNSLPSQAADQFRRQLHCQPKGEDVFLLTSKSRKVIQSIQRELDRALLSTIAAAG